MSKKEKLKKRLQAKPRDFTFDEVETLLLSLDFEKSNKGKTSGSSVEFILDDISILIHKPHPRKELKPYQVKQVLNTLERNDLI